MMFAIITPAVISGAIVQKLKLVWFTAFAGLWSIFVYCPLAHWVWAPGAWVLCVRVQRKQPCPPLYSYLQTSTRLRLLGSVLRALTPSRQTDGWLFQRGLLDFAGGTVVEVG